jgi:hypothetical protein
MSCAPRWCTWACTFQELNKIKNGFLQSAHTKTGLFIQLSPAPEHDALTTNQRCSSRQISILCFQSYSHFNGKNRQTTTRLLSYYNKQTFSLITNYIFHFQPDFRSLDSPQNQNWQFRFESLAISFEASALKQCQNSPLARADSNYCCAHWTPPPRWPSSSSDGYSARPRDWWYWLWRWCERAWSTGCKNTWHVRIQRRRTEWQQLNK